LIDAAFQRVAEVGFEGLRLREVAERVGIDHSTLHHHFATKQDLIVGIAAYTTSQFRSSIPAGDDPAARLRGHLLTLRGLLAQRPELFTVTVELDLRARRDPAVDAAMRGYESGWRAALIDVLSQGVRARSWVGAVDPEAAAELIIAAIKGARLAPERAEAVFDQLEALLIG
jgi:TetR/AcrR family transcriptional repressor of nem operon